MPKDVKNRPRILNKHRVEPSKSTTGFSKFPLAALPQSIRVRIWNLLGFGYTRTLRLVCPAFKHDIDTVAGIFSAIDSTFEDFSFHCNIAIRKCAIHELIVPKYVEFLKYPLSLHELEIRGEISSENFTYIITSCPNITKLLIVFNVFVIEHKTPLFPLSEKIRNHPNKPLSKLKAIKISSTTKTMESLYYVYSMIVGLITESLPQQVQLESLQILMSHSNSNVTYTEIMATTIQLIHKHAPTLRYLNLMFRCHDPHAIAEKLACNKDNKPPQPQQQRKSIENEGARRDTSCPCPGATNHPPPPPLPDANVPKVQIHHTKDVHTEGEPINTEDNDTDAEGEPVPEEEGEANATAVSENSDGEETNEKIQEITRYIKENPWLKSPYLHFMILSLPHKFAEYLVNILHPETKLESLNVEAFANPRHHANNWKFFNSFLLITDPRNLKSITFHHINNEDSKGDSMPLDLQIFEGCRSLRKLTLLCDKKDDFKKLSTAKNISSLPKTLQEFHSERLLLTPCQVFRLCFRYTRLQTLTLSYWSKTDCDFTTSLAFIKYIVCMDWTDLRRINLIDTKIRFKTNRTPVRDLQKALDIHSVYQDFDETRLILDLDVRKKDERGYAPRISVVEEFQSNVKQVRRSVEKKGRTRSSIISLAKLQTDSSKVSVF